MNNHASDQKTSCLYTSTFHKLMLRLDGLALLIILVCWCVLAAGSYMNGDSFLLIVPIIYALTTIFVYIVCYCFRGRGIIGATVISGLNAPIIHNYPW